MKSFIHCCSRRLARRATACVYPTSALARAGGLFNEAKIDHSGSRGSSYNTILESGKIRHNLWAVNSQWFYHWTMWWIAAIAMSLRGRQDVAISIYRYVCIYILVHMYWYRYRCMRRWICIYLYICICICIHTVYIYTYVYIYIHTYMNVCMCIHVYIYMY